MMPHGRYLSPLSLLPLLTICMPLCGGDFGQFRGNDGQGHSDEKNLPLTWSETENIAWKTPIDGLGWSSPSIQGDQIWVTSGVNDGQVLKALCLDKKTGKIVHDVIVFELDDPGHIHSKNSHASPTPVIDGDRVIVHFGGHGMACLSREGKVLWKTQELKYAHQHGPGGSPVVYQDLVLINCDGTDVQFVTALDKKTGKIVWKVPRAHISEARRTGEDTAAMGFSTPLLIEVNGKTQLISTGGDHVAAYDPLTGKEIWWSEYYGYSLVPRPVFGHGMVYVCSGYNSPMVYAIRVDGRGDVTKTHVAWKLDKGKGAPLNPSPLLVGDELYLVNDGGIARCLEAKTGEQHWQERLEGNYSASPLFADGRIYFLNEKAVTTVIAPGKEFKELAKNTLPGRTLASIAAADGALFLRTDQALYRIQK